MDIKYLDRKGSQRKGPAVGTGLICSSKSKEAHGLQASEESRR